MARFSGLGGDISCLSRYNRSMTRWRKAALGSTVLSLLSPAVSQASGRLVVDPADSRTIRIAGFVDRPNEFVAHIRLRALGGPIASFEMVASDLHRRGGIRVGRDQVALTG